MSPERWRELRELFDEAERVPADQLSEWMRHKCGDDGDLRKELEYLLRNHAEAKSFLSEPVQHLGPIGPVLKPSDVVGERFEIEALVGVGGMGEVYRAYDTRLERKVAIKMLPDALSQDTDQRRRLEREAKAVARLEHPNICSLHDVGVDRGRGYLVMEYLEGQTLAKRLEAGPLAFEEWRRIAVEVLEALVCAHAAGIVHRDLKPGNIMLTAAGAKLLDFGIARLQHQGASVENDGFRTQTTGQQAVVGTLAYMSPEQAEGKPVDARSDLFSFGCVLYEMVSGRRAFVGDSAVSVLAAVVRGEPEPLGRIAQPQVQALINRCLAKNPESRYRSASALLKDVAGLNQRRASKLPSLRKAALAGAVALLLVALGTLANLVRRANEPGTPNSPPAVVVLPFTNVSHEPEIDYLVDGLSDSITNSLSRMGTIHVVARSAALTFKGRNPTISEIRRDLKVDRIVFGRVSHVRKKLRVQLELKDAAEGTQLWGRSYEASEDNVLQIEGDIVRDLGEELGRVGARASPTLAVRKTTNPDAYNLYLRGRQALERVTNSDAQRAIGLFQQALQIDPQFASAYAGLGESYWLLGGSDLTTGQAIPKAKAAIQRAIQLDPKLADAWVTMGSILTEWDYSYADAQDCFRRALEIDRNHPFAHIRYGWAAIAQGRRAEAVQYAERAYELDPLTPYIETGLAQILCLAGRCDEAVKHLNTVTKTDPKFYFARLAIGMAYVDLGRFDKAAFELEIGDQIQPDRPYLLGHLTHAYWKTGRRAEALRLWKRLNEMKHTGSPGAYPLAIAALAVSTPDEAVRWLKVACDEHEDGVLFVATDSVLDPLRTHPRFAEVLRCGNIGVVPPIR